MFTSQMRISRKIFGILCAFSIAACITNIVATFSSEWRTLTSRNGDVWKSGLFKWNCRAPQPAPHDSNKCDNWWQNQNDWEVVVVISMIVAFASMCLGLVTTTFPREKFVYSFSFFSILWTIFLGISVIVYGLNNKEITYHFYFGEGVTEGYGIGFWLALIAFLLSIGVTITILVLLLDVLKARPLLRAMSAEELLKKQGWSLVRTSEMNLPLALGDAVCEALLHLEQKRNSHNRLENMKASQQLEDYFPAVHSYKEGNAVEADE